MKKLFIIAACVLVAFSGCYKEQKPIQAYNVMTSHRWKIESHIYTSADSGVDCRVPQEVEFSKDSTGYFYYYTPCFVGDTAKKTFRWYVSYDNLVLHYSDLEGVPGTALVCGLSYFDNTTLRLHAEQHRGHFWDGYFKAFEDKK